MKLYIILCMMLMFNEALLGLARLPHGEYGWVFVWHAFTTLSTLAICVAFVWKYKVVTK